MATWSRADGSYCPGSLKYRQVRQRATGRDSYRVVERLLVALLISVDVLPRNRRSEHDSMAGSQLSGLPPCRKSGRLKLGKPVQFPIYRETGEMTVPRSAAFLPR